MVNKERRKEKKIGRKDKEKKAQMKDKGNWRLMSKNAGDREYGKKRGRVK